MTRSGRPAAADPDSALDPARRAAARCVFFAWVLAKAAGHTVFLFLRRGADRAPARPARARARGAQDPARDLGGARVPDVRRGDPRDPRRPRHRRRHPDEDGGEPVQRLFHRPERTEPTGRPRRQPAAALARTRTTCRASRSSRAGTGSCSASGSATSASYTHRIVNFVEGAAISIGKALFDCVLIVVVSIYMLLDMQRLARAVDRRFPPHSGRPLICADGARARLLRAGAGRAQPDHRLDRRARSLDPRASPGSCPGPTTTPSCSAAWVALTEVLPYLGPWLGAIPPVIYALVVHPFSVDLGRRCSSSASTSSRATSSCRR